MRGNENREEIEKWYSDDVTSSSSEFYVFRWGMTSKAQSLDAAYHIYPMRLTVITLTKIDCTLSTYFLFSSNSLVSFQNVQKCLQFSGFQRYFALDTQTTTQPL
jgi:hypothetical protein